MTDHTLRGILEAEQRHGISGTPSMSDTDILSAVDQIRARPPAPYVPPVTQIAIPDKERVFTPEVKRVSVVIIVAGMSASIYSVVTMNGAVIVAIVAPWVGIAIGFSGLAFLVSALIGAASGSSGKSGSGNGKHETHYHYHQYNNQGHGSQNNHV